MKNPIGQSETNERRSGPQIRAEPRPSSSHCLARARQRDGEIDRLDKARLAGDAAARYVEGRSVVDGGPDDGKAERDVHAAQSLPAAGFAVDREAEQLHRNVSLVVIHGDHGVELFRTQFHEDGIAGHGPVHIVPLLAQALDRRLDDIDVLPSEQAAFAGMRIERRDGDAAARNIERLERASVSDTTRLIRSGVTRFGTSSSAVWVVIWLTRILP